MRETVPLAERAGGTRESIGPGKQSSIFVFIAVFNFIFLFDHPPYSRFNFTIVNT